MYAAELAATALLISVGLSIVILDFGNGTPVARLNPARSLGPAVVSGQWRGWWIYWAGPLAAAVLGVALLRGPLLATAEVEVAKIWHFEHDRHGIFRAGAQTPAMRPPKGRG